jgi:hypothetical protein
MSSLEITSLCLSSSYKTFNGKTLYSKLEFYAEDEHDVNRYESSWKFNIMFKFKLQDNQREEHYIPNWNFMPKTKKK